MISEHVAAPESGVRAAAWVAWPVCVLSVAFAALGLLFLFLHGSFAVVINDESVGVNAVVAVVFPMVGAIIASRRPGNAVGWIFCTIGLFEGVSVFAGEYGRYFLHAESGHLPAGIVAVWLGTWMWVPGVGLTTTFLLLLFPHGRLPSRRWRPVAWLAVLGIALGAATLAILPWDLLDLPAENPLGVEGVRNAEVVLGLCAGVLWTVSTLLCLTSLVVRFRRSRGEERQQIKWFVYAGAVTVAFFFVPLIPPLSDIGTALQILTAPFLPVAAGIAILRYRLYDIDLVINRTLVYGALTAIIVGIYILVVGYLGTLFRTGGNLTISLVATGIVAVLFAPLRGRLQRAVNRLMYGERDEPYAAISRLGERMAATLAPDAVLPTIIETVREALKLPYAAIALPRDGGFEVAAVSGGEQPAAPLILPLSYGGETVGRLVLAPRAPGEGFSADDRRLLDDLARHAGVAVHGVRVMADLRRSREGLVLAREEERRRLRRDLHDELAPTLAALGLTAATVGELITADPNKAASTNEKLRSAIRATVGDVRRLVYDLRPPALDDLGLVEAIRERTSRLEAEQGLRVTVEAPEELPALPAAVEVAAYRIAQEALTNVSRHARTGACSVRLACTGSPSRALTVEVTDDGVGLPDEPGGGVGLHSMRERAAELGGTCEIERSSPAGTRVFVRLPLPKEASGFGQQTSSVKSKGLKPDA